jgi:hypothetical protein
MTSAKDSKVTEDDQQDWRSELLAQVLQTSRHRSEQSSTCVHSALYSALGLRGLSTLEHKYLRLVSRLYDVYVTQVQQQKTADANQPCLSPKSPNVLHNTQFDWPVEFV